MTEHKSVGWRAKITPVRWIIDWRRHVKVDLRTSAESPFDPETEELP